ncbi:hypothetical protein ABW20_dc0106106 [Dactylellina cionopaga]|nr:hypothetical protein ABW20_dc0106106 [Dactylellina cionopaga]
MLLFFFYHFLSSPDDIYFLRRISSTPTPYFNSESTASTLTSSQRQSYLRSKAHRLSKIPFPKTIWQTWKTSSLSDTNYESFHNTWINLNPTHDHLLLNDSSALQYVIDNFNASDPYIVDLYKNLPQRILAADLLRYLLIFKDGGLYTDVDTECRVPVDKWLDVALEKLPDTKPSEINVIVGMEVDVLDEVEWPESRVAEAGFGQRIQFLQWTIYAKPGHEILQRMVTSAQEAIREDIEKKPNKTVVVAEGPSIFMAEFVEVLLIVNYLRDVNGSPYFHR